MSDLDNWWFVSAVDPADSSAVTPVEVFNDPRWRLPILVLVGSRRRISLTPAEAWAVWAVLMQAMHTLGDPPAWALDMACPPSGNFL